MLLLLILKRDGQVTFIGGLFHFFEKWQIAFVLIVL